MDLSTYFEGLMQKTSIPSSELEHFLYEMRKANSGALITSKLLIEKIQSENEIAAIRAFDFLEMALSSESEGSIEFRTEVGRYRFLNELIRILSPKYSGNRTTTSVKERAIEFLTQAAGSKRKQWFPSEHSKIVSVYQSLVDGKIILANAVVDPDAEFQKSIFERGDNALLLKRLLRSSNPVDLQAANSLIKKLVDEEAKRNERRSELHSLLDRIDTSTSLLIEMCTQTQIDTEITNDLSTSCTDLRKKLGSIGSETNEETSALLQASESIEKALKLYEQKKNDSSKVSALTDVNDVSEKTSFSECSLLSIKDDFLFGQSLPQDLSKKHNYTHLPSTSVFISSLKDGNLLNLDFEIKQSNKPENIVEVIDVKEAIKKTGLEEIGDLNKQLFEQSLSGLARSALFTNETSKKTKKFTLSQLQDISKTTNEPKSSNFSKINDVADENNKKNDSITLLDLEFLEINSASTIPKESISKDIIEDDTPLVIYSENKNSKFSLDEIKDVDLEEVEIIDIAPTNSFISLENDLIPIELNFNFGTHSKLPPSVKVAIVTLSNKNYNLGLSNYSFQLLPPKGYQVKLFPPSATELSSWKKKFLPAPVLTQAALILLPPMAHHKSKIKFILSFYIGDETKVHNSEFELPSSL